MKTTLDYSAHVLAELLEHNPMHIGDIYQQFHSRKLSVSHLANAIALDCLVSNRICRLTPFALQRFTLQDSMQISRRHGLGVGT